MENKEVLSVLLRQETTFNKEWKNGSWTEETKALSLLERQETKFDSWFCQEQKAYTNLTRQWLFDANCENYLRVLDRIVNVVKQYHYTTEVSDLQGFATDFLTNLCVKDTLAPHLNEDKEIKDSVLISWFKQYIKHEWQKQGLNPIARSVYGAKSQAEVKSGLDYTKTHHEYYTAVVEGDSESNKETTFDFVSANGFNGNEGELRVEEDSFKSSVYNVLKKKHKEDYEMLYQVFIGKLYETYDTKRKWSRSLGITERQLNNNIDKVYSAIKSIGRDALGW
jgi:hypothetical protein